MLQALQSRSTILGFHNILNIFHLSLLPSNLLDRSMAFHPVDHTSLNIGTMGLMLQSPSIDGPVHRYGQTCLNPLCWKYLFFVNLKLHCSKFYLIFYRCQKWSFAILSISGFQRSWWLPPSCSIDPHLWTESISAISLHSLLTKLYKLEYLEVLFNAPLFKCCELCCKG